MATFDFAVLQQKADQVLKNSDEAIRKWVDFISAPAGDVNLEYYDQNGNLKTAVFANKNKLVQDFIVNVNSVMRRIFYVDQINGNDANDGSLTSPFKTVKKAIESAPSGSVVEVRVIGDYVLTAADESAIYTTNKYVIIVDSTLNNTYNFTINVNFANDNGRIFNGSNSGVMIAKFNTVTIDFQTDTLNTFVFWGTGEFKSDATTKNMTAGIVGVNTIILKDTSGGTQAKYLSAVDLRLSSSTVEIDNTTIKLASTASSTIRFMSDVTSYVDSLGNAINPQDYIYGIVWRTLSTSGERIPTNILTNLILT